jgi:hypothetical protein
MKENLFPRFKAFLSTDCNVAGDLLPYMVALRVLGRISGCDTYLLPRAPRALLFGPGARSCRLARVVPVHIVRYFPQKSLDGASRRTAAKRAAAPLLILSSKSRRAPPHRHSARAAGSWAMV